MATAAVLQIRSGIRTWNCGRYLGHPVRRAKPCSAWPQHRSPTRRARHLAAEVRGGTSVGLPCCDGLAGARRGQLAFPGLERTRIVHVVPLEGAMATEADRKPRTCRAGAKCLYSFKPLSIHTPCADIHLSRDAPSQPSRGMGRLRSGPSRWWREATRCLCLACSFPVNWPALRTRTRPLRDPHALGGSWDGGSLRIISTDRAPIGPQPAGHRWPTPLLLRAHWVAFRPCRWDEQAWVTATAAEDLRSCGPAELPLSTTGEGHGESRGDSSAAAADLRGTSGAILHDVGALKTDQKVSGKQSQMVLGAFWPRIGHTVR